MCYGYPGCQEYTLLHPFWVVPSFYSFPDTVASLKCKVWCNGWLIFGSVSDNRRSCLGGRRNLFSNHIIKLTVPQLIGPIRYYQYSLCSIWPYFLNNSGQSCKLWESKVCPQHSENIHCIWFRVWLIRYKFSSWLLSLDVNNSIYGETLSWDDSEFRLTWEPLRFSINSVLSSCFLDSLSASSLNTPGICIAVSQLFCVLMNSHIRCTSLSIPIDFTLPILLTAETADVISIWIRMWLMNSFLHKAPRPNLAAFSSKILICCWVSSENCPPVLFCPSDAPPSQM